MRCGPWTLTLSAVLCLDRLKRYEDRVIHRKEPTMTKNTKKTTEESQAMEPGGGVAVADRPSVTEPFGWMGDWFDSWPTMFGRRIPELFERGPGSLEGHASRGVHGR